MKSNTYRGGEENEKFRNTKSDSMLLLPEANPLPKPTKQKSTSQRFEPTSDEISIEKSIDEIFRTTKYDQPHRQSSHEASPLPKPTKQESSSDEISIEKSIDKIF